MTGRHFPSSHAWWGNWHVSQGPRQPAKASSHYALMSPGLRLIALALAASIASVLATACRGSDPRPASPATPPPVTVSASAVSPTAPPAAATATPSPASNPTATATFTAVNQDLTVSVRICQPSPLGSGADTVGTAPLPTPRPASTSARPPELVKSEISAFYAAAAPVAALGDDWIRWADSRLAAATATGDVAAALRTHAVRLWELCSAAALLPDVPEATPAAQSFRAALLERNAWLGAAAEQLRCCGFAAVMGLGQRQQASTGAMESARKGLEALAAAYGVARGALPVRKEVSSTILGLSLETPAGWVVVDSSGQIIVLSSGDTRQLLPDSLGPRQWDLGSALRIRRLRNPPAMDLNAAETRARTLLGGLGSMRGERAVMFAGMSAVEQVRVDEATDWQVKVVIAVRGEFTYLFESGYPAQDSGVAAEFDQALASVKFRN